MDFNSSLVNFRDFNSSVVNILIKQAARVAQWLERRRKDLVILASLVRIPLWDVGAGPSDETV
jgi:hypothetical protein